MFYLTFLTFKQTVKKSLNLTFKVKNDLNLFKKYFFISNVSIGEHFIYGHLLIQFLITLFLKRMPKFWQSFERQLKSNQRIFVYVILIFEQNSTFNWPIVLIIPPLRSCYSMYTAVVAIKLSKLNEWRFPRFLTT